MSKKDLGLCSGILLFTVVALYCTYWLNLPGPIEAIVWIVWLMAFVFMGYLTAYGQNIYSFINEAKVELQKIVWPSRQETTKTTMIIMIMVVSTGFILWAMDSLLTWLIAKITYLG